MSSIPQLSEGCLSDMLVNSHVERPVLQLLGFKPLHDQQKEPQKRMRFVVSDGIATSSQCLCLAEAFNQRLIRGELDKFSVIRVERYMCNKVNNSDKPVLILHEVSLLMPGTQINRKLGVADSCAADMMAKADNQANANRNGAAVDSPMDTNDYYNRNYRNSVSSATNSALNAIPKQSLINPENVCPISAITPYYNAWLIRARVTSKTQIRTYSNAKGEGRVFSFDVTDDSGEIRVTAFTNECDKFVNLVQTDMVYYISKGNVKTANKKFSSLNNDYEITLNSDSIIELCRENVALPKLRFRFVGIASLADVNVNSTVDVIGILRSVGEIEHLISKKTNKELRKRDVTLLDKTGCEVRLTIWNKDAEDFSGTKGSVLAIKNALVGEFKGKTLSALQSSTLQFDPDLSEAHVLKGWYDREGHALANVTSLSKSGDASGSSSAYKFLSQANINSISDSSVTYFSTKAMVLSTGKPNSQLYKSCGSNGCMKKVRDENNGYYHCDKCNRDTPTFEWRLMLSILVTDCTGEMWLTLFQENAEKLIGKSTKEISTLFENDSTEYQNVMSSVNFKSFNFRVGARVEEYNGERRVKCSGYSAVVINPVDRARQLIQCIKAWNQ